MSKNVTLSPAATVSIVLELSDSVCSSMSRTPLSTLRVLDSWRVGSDSSTFQKRMRPSEQAARTVWLSIQLHFEIETTFLLICHV